MSSCAKICSDHILCTCWVLARTRMFFLFSVFSLPQQCASVVLDPTGPDAIFALPAILFVRCGICILRPNNPSFSSLPSLKTGAPDLPESQWRGVGCVFRYPLIMMPTKHVLTKITKKARAREFCDPTRFELVDFPPSNRQWRD